MRNYLYVAKLFCVIFLSVALGGCVLLLLNGHLSHGYYISPSESFKCKLPGGALSRQLEISDDSNSLGETVIFNLKLGLLWRVDHLKLGHHKLAIMNTTLTERENLDQAKSNYFKYHLEPNLDEVDINLEYYKKINESDVLIVHAYMKWKDKEEKRELLFSIDNDYLNVVHHSQNISSNLQKVTFGSIDMYKSCQF